MSAQVLRIEPVRVYLLYFKWFEMEYLELSGIQNKILLTKFAVEIKNIFIDWYCHV